MDPTPLPEEGVRREGRLLDSSSGGEPDLDLEFTDILEDGLLERLGRDYVSHICLCYCYYFGGRNLEYLLAEFFMSFASIGQPVQGFLLPLCEFHVAIAIAAFGKIEQLVWAAIIPITELIV